MYKWLKFIIIPAATVAAIVGIGAFLNTPSPFVDAITGATAKVNGAETDSLEGKYIFVMNTDSAAFRDSAVRDEVKGAVAADGRGVTFGEGVTFTLAVSEDDRALSEYAQALAQRLREAGAGVTVRGFSKTELRSRVPLGKYESFISTRGFTDAEAVKHSEYIMLDSEDMKL